MGSLEPRNHLSVPKRSDRETMASRYCERMLALGGRVPKGGRNEERPVRGGGGGERMAGRMSFDEIAFGVSRSNRRGDGVGWNKISAA